MTENSTPPNSELTEDLPVESSEGLHETSISENDVSLPNQGALSPAGAAEIMGADITRLVLLGGALDSGKTTLISSIYERLHLGPFASFTLGWSSSLMGFEEICHESREKSNQPEPDTLRTSRQLGRLLYHLRLHDTNGNPQELLLTDLSGEEYEDLRKFDDVLPNVEIVERADHFCLLVDGDRIADLAERHQTIDEGITILRVLSENQLLGISTHVHVVFSKWEVISSGSGSVTALACVEQAEATISGQFDGVFASLQFHKIIARAPDGSRAPATNVDHLLTQWLANRRKLASGPPLNRQVGWRRPFDRFSARKGGEQ